MPEISDEDSKILQMRNEGRFTDLPKRLRETTEALACTANGLDMGLWNAHSNAALDAASKIEALERDVNAAYERGLRDAADEALKENRRCLDLASIRIPAMACEIHKAILKLIPKN